MRKENNAIKKRLTAQIQDLRRQVVTKQAFDKGELMDEIARSKKELAFANKKLYHKKIQAEGAGGSGQANNQGNTQNFSGELENSMKLVETINNQKRVLETENEELKSRMNDMLNDKSSNLASALDQAVSSSQAQHHMRPGIPPLNFNSGGTSIY